MQQPHGEPTGCICAAKPGCQPPCTLGLARKRSPLSFLTRGCRCRWMTCTCHRAPHDHRPGAISLTVTCADALAHPWSCMCVLGTLTCVLRPAALRSRTACRRTSASDWFFTPTVRTLPLPVQGGRLVRALHAFWRLQTRHVRGKGRSRYSAWK
jgi:hypothetical protein